MTCSLLFAIDKRTNSTDETNDNNKAAYVGECHIYYNIYCNRIHVNTWLQIYSCGETNFSLVLAVICGVMR